MDPMPARVTEELQNKIYGNSGDNDMRYERSASAHTIYHALKIYVSANCMIIRTDSISKD